MFGRLIGKISSFTRTATLRRFSQVQDKDNKQKEDKDNDKKEDTDNKQKDDPVCIESSLKEFSTSITTFYDMAKPGKIFVDKSLLIERLLNTTNKAFLFTRPRRWGKTLNIDMLENFFQADVNMATGIPDFKNNEQKSLFKKLNIASQMLKEDPITGKPINGSAINFQGQFPVIKLTVNDSSPQSHENVIRGFEEILRPAFEKHSYILNSNKRFLIDRECTLIEEYVYNKSKKITWMDIGLSLKYLINALNKVYDRKVILLIDEYDRDLNTLFAKNSPFYSDTLELFKFLLDPIKNNNKLLLTVFTGATRMVKAGIFTGLNHFCHDSVTDSGFSEFFGFTEAEVDSLLNTLIGLNPKLQRKEVKDLVTMWYNGYRIGDKTIYNPWSIMHCFNKLHNDRDDPYQPYWIEVGSSTLLEDAVKAVPTIDKIEELIINGQTEFKDVVSLTFDKIKTDERSLFSFLLDSGYITKIKKDFYKVPNYEVYSYFFKDLLPLWLEKRFPKINIDLLKKNFGNAQAYGEAFRQEFLDRLQNLDYSEKYFQVLVNLQFNMLNPNQDIHNKYNEQCINENKRIDILLIPVKGKSESVFILELKKTDTFWGIDKKIKEALIQVFDKKYVDFALQLAEKTENKHWKSFHIRAMVFSPDELDKKWILTIKELEFYKENLQKAIKKFEQIRIKADQMLKKKKEEEDKKDKENIEDKKDKKNKKSKKEKKDKKSIVDEKLIKVILSFSNSISECSTNTK